MPRKDDYDDVDFLVCGPLHSSTSTNIKNYDWNGAVRLIKEAFDTTHGRRGFLNPDCMYFAVDTPHGERGYFIQIDVKLCFKPELFNWSTFEFNYASNSKIIGSMDKPLGLTIDSEGLHICVEDIEQTNFPGSMEWLPVHYPGYRFLQEDPMSGKHGENTDEQSHEDIQAWFKRMRAAVRDKLFTMFPHIVTEYYTNRAVYLKEREEHRLRELITKAIPTDEDGWKNDFSQPRIIVKHLEPTTPELKPTTAGELTPPPTPPASDYGLIDEATLSAPSVNPRQPWDLAIYLDPLQRAPQFSCTPVFHQQTCHQRPKFSASLAGRSSILAPAPLNFSFHRAGTLKYSGRALRMWKKRFEKDDKNAEMAEMAEMARQEVEVKAKAEEMVKAKREKIAGRLKALSAGLGFVVELAR
ncbi:hypothetical protein EJ02DRAFT_425345 [Clathrospora elynae]|uniref:Uncharacterized protein n=1 Tax=Clathrospora elynae TaxID=706981 RepID=A0A6A5SHQ3_9PLEO|nr:hypothetical protein EJ02DRAFT_425345 [Clathrospora elynae]